MPLINNPSGSVFNNLSLAAYYKLDANGTDLSGNGYNLTGMNVTYTGPGKFGKAVVTNSNNGNNYVTSELGLTLAAGFTYSIWWKMIGPESSANALIINHGLPTQNCYIYMSYLAATTRCMWALGGTTGAEFYYTYVPSTTKFEHFVFVYTGKTTIGYINGREVGRSDQTSSGTHAQPARFNIGAYWIDAPERLHMNGYYDECIVSRRPWTPQEIYNYYRQSEGVVNATANY
jgi:hypothetical protein